MGYGMNGDIHKLANDNMKLKTELEKLEQDHAVWASNREEKDLEKITKCLKRLEADVSLLASDCSFQAGRHDGNGLGEDLHHAYVHLNRLFEDVKKAGSDLERAYIPPGEIFQIEIDWERLKKTVAEITEHLRD